MVSCFRFIFSLFFYKTIKVAHIRFKSNQMIQGSLNTNKMKRRRKLAIQVSDKLKTEAKVIILQACKECQTRSLYRYSRKKVNGVRFNKALMTKNRVLPDKSTISGGDHLFW